MIPKSMPSDLIDGWKPVFGKDHAPMKNLEKAPESGRLKNSAAPEIFLSGAV
jgi:hypothetical protein